MSLLAIIWFSDPNLPNMFLLTQNFSFFKTPTPKSTRYVILRRSPRFYQNCRFSAQFRSKLTVVAVTALRCAQLLHLYIQCGKFDLWVDRFFFSSGFSTRSVKILPYMHIFKIGKNSPIYVDFLEFNFWPKSRKKKKQYCLVVFYPSEQKKKVLKIESQCCWLSL